MKHRLLLTNDHAGDDRQLAYLFAADRYDHLFNAVDGLVGLLARGTHVISTRYFLSSFAYHCDSEETFHLVQRLNADFPLPDITFFLDTPVAMCLERIHRGRVVPEKYENERKLLDVRRRYEEAIQRLNMSVIVLDGRERIDTLAAKVHEHVEERMQHVKR
jgi:dTMP kinase